jgi:hypothetical protein
MEAEWPTIVAAGFAAVAACASRASITTNANASGQKAAKGFVSGVDLRDGAEAVDWPDARGNAPRTPGRPKARSRGVMNDQDHSRAAVLI